MAECSAYFAVDYWNVGSNVIGVGCHQLPWMWISASTSILFPHYTGSSSETGRFKNQVEGMEMGNTPWESKLPVFWVLVFYRHIITDRDSAVDTQHAFRREFHLSPSDPIPSANTINVFWNKI